MGTLFLQDLPDADVRHLAGWLPPVQADALHARLLEAIPWETHRIRMFGRWVDSPRLSCWMGDVDARYRYSGADFLPHPWPSVLLPLRDRLQEERGARFNSVLLNRYRSGTDSMGWHSDDEPELGPQPVIASLSLGAARRFLLRRRDRPAVKREFLLAEGDLFVMAGSTQTHYQHALPRSLRVHDERINLTFRWILAARSASNDQQGQREDLTRSTAADNTPRPKRR